MDVAELSRIVDKHRKHIQDPKIFLVARDGRMVISSANPVGTVLRSIIKSDAKLDACVASEALSALLKAAKTVDMAVENGRLVIKSSSDRIKCDIPLDGTGTTPLVPKSDALQSITPADLDTIQDILPMVNISHLEKSGQLSVRCKDGEMYVSYADELHGAIFYGESTSSLEFGMFPNDVELLRSALSNDKPTFAQIDGRIIIKSGGETAVIPTTECIYIGKDAATATPTAMLDVVELRKVLSAVSAIASSKDASPVRVVLSPPDSLSIQVSSPVGSLSKKLTAKVIRKASFGVSYALLGDLVSKLDNKSKLSLFEENQAVVRIQLESNGVVYAALTSDDQ